MLTNAKKMIKIVWVQRSKYEIFDEVAFYEKSYICTLNG